MAGTRIVVPFYNEARRLEPARMLEFLAATPAVSLVLVDDGSTDGTRALLERVAAESGGRAELVGLPANRGKAAAVWLGVQRALDGTPEFFGYWDGDLSTPLEMIPPFVDVFGERPGLTLVMGARVQLLGRQIERSALRHSIGRLGATAIAWTLGLRVYDTQCGAKLFRTSEESRALFAEPFLAGWLFDVEILARLIRRRMDRGAPSAAHAVYEYPLPAWRHVAGSKVRPLDYPRAALDLVRIGRRYLARPGLGTPARVRI
jgi:glycosyltransferase involved in cell wall biosynthesis